MRNKYIIIALVVLVCIFSACSSNVSSSELPETNAVENEVPAKPTSSDTDAHSLQELSTDGSLPEILEYPNEDEFIKAVKANQIGAEYRPEELTYYYRPANLPAKAKISLVSVFPRFVMLDYYVGEEIEENYLALNWLRNVQDTKVFMEEASTTNGETRQFFKSSDEIKNQVAMDVLSEYDNADNTVFAAIDGSIVINDAKFAEPDTSQIDSDTDDAIIDHSDTMNDLVDGLVDGLVEETAVESPPVEQSNVDNEDADISLDPTTSEESDLQSLTQQQTELQAKVDLIVNNYEKTINNLDAKGFQFTGYTSFYDGYEPKKEHPFYSEAPKVWIATFTYDGNVFIYYIPYSVKDYELPSLFEIEKVKI